MAVKQIMTTPRAHAHPYQAVPLPAQLPMLGLQPLMLVQVPAHLLPDEAGELVVLSWVFVRMSPWSMGGGMQTSGLRDSRERMGTATTTTTTKWRPK